MKHQHKALASLIAGLLGTTLAHNALAVGVISLNAAKADLYASEMSTPEITISSAYVTKLGAGDLPDTDTAVFAGKTSYVRVDFSNATITTTATVQLGGVGTQETTDASSFIGMAVTAGANPTPNYGTFGIGMTSAGYSPGGGLYAATFGGHNFIPYNSTVTTNLGSESNCPTATGSLGLIGTDGIKLSATASGTGTAIFALTEGGTRATAATGTETTHVLAGCRIGFYISHLKVIDTTKPVTMSYSLHTNNVSASYPLGDPKSTPAAKKLNVPVINFAPALSYTLTAKDATSEVAALFKEFKAGENGSIKTAGVVGLLDIKTTDGIKDVTGTVISSIGTILGAGSKLDITGDFSTIAANKGRVYVTKGASCATTSADLISSVVELPSSATAGDYTASLTMDYIGTSANVTGNSVGRICLDVTNTTGTVSTSGTEIAATDNAFLVKFSPQPETNYKPYTPKEGTAGKIVRNGAELEAPYITASSGFTTRILLSNFSDAKMPFTVKLATDGVGGSILPTAVLPKVAALTAPPAGSTLPVYGVTGKSYHAAGEVPAKSMLFINTTSQLATVTGGGRYSATFTFQGGNENVQGVVQTINKTTGEVTSIPMVRKGGGNGN
jgi:hypothetical protein